MSPCRPCMCCARRHCSMAWKSAHRSSRTAGWPGDLVERVAEISARTVVTIRADQIQLGIKLVVTKFQLDALLLHVQPRLQQIRPFGHALAPTVLQIEQLRRRLSVSVGWMLVPCHWNRVGEQIFQGVLIRTECIARDESSPGLRNLRLIRCTLNCASVPICRRCLSWSSCVCARLSASCCTVTLS